MQRSLPEQFIQAFLQEMDSLDTNTSKSKTEYDGYRSLVRLNDLDKFLAAINTLYDSQLERLVKESSAFRELLTKQADDFVKVVATERMYNLLFAACQHNHLELTNQLLNLLKPNLPTVKCGRFIVLAAATPSLELFKSIFTCYPRDKMPRPGAIVAAAVKSRSHEILAFLMSEGFDPNVTDDLSIYEINYRYNSPLYYAIENSDLVSLNMLIAHGAKLESHTTHVIRKGNVDILNVFLSKNISFRNVHDYYAYKTCTTLAVAASSNSPAMVRAVGNQPEVFVKPLLADSSPEIIVGSALRHAAIDVLPVLEQEFAVPVKEILKKHFGCDDSDDASLLIDAIESFNTAVLKYIFEVLNIVPSVQSIKLHLAKAVNESVGGSSHMKLATHCYLYSYCHEDSLMQTLLRQAATTSLQQLASETLFILFLEHELLYPKSERYRDNDYFGSLATMLYTEIAKRRIPTNDLLVMANSDKTYLAPAIMYYLCTAGEGYTEQQRLTLMQSDCFDVNHAYHHGARPLHMALHYRHIFLIETIVMRGADPDAYYDKLNCTPLTQIRVERPQTDLMLERANNLSNTMRLAITLPCEILPVKCMKKINGDLDQLQVGELIPWLQTANRRLIHVFNVLQHCNPSSFATVSALITASNDDDLKEVLDNVNLYKQTGKITDKFAQYQQMQKEGGIIVKTFFQPCSFNMKVWKEMPTLKNFK